MQEAQHFSHDPRARLAIPRLDFELSSSRSSLSSHSSHSSSMKRYRVQIVARALVLVALSLVGAYLAGLVGRTSPAALAWLVGVALLIAYAIGSLVRYGERTAREVTRFLESVRYSDFAVAYSGGGRGPVFDELAAAFTDVTDAFRRVRAESEARQRYLRSVVQHVGVALVSFREGGEVDFVNQATRRLLGVGRLRHVGDLAAVSPALAEALRTSVPGEQALVRVQRADRTLQLAVRVGRFRLGDRAYALASIQDLGPVLEEKEMEAWQQLTRVLTHEIMNSVAPIVSLAGTAHRRLAAPRTSDSPPTSVPPARDARTSEPEEPPASMPQPPDVRTFQAPPTSDPPPTSARRTSEPDEPRTSALPPTSVSGAAPSPEALRDVQEAVEIIERRGEALMHFVDAYRSFTRIPAPRFEMIAVRPLLARVARLFRAPMEEQGVACAVDVEPPELRLTADPELVEQVLINLLLNAIQAVAGQPAPHSMRGPERRVVLRARPDRRGIAVLEVTDTGPGIAPDVQERIFVPFFTTKAEGSGIGLSLSRQILRLHGGTLRVRSTPGEGATFTMRF